jgi:hypothetical protein
VKRKTLWDPIWGEFHDNVKYYFDTYERGDLIESISGEIF